MITLRIISLALFLALEASGQTQTTGGISGTIQDSLNDYVAGARVTVTRISTHEQRTIATGEEGRFSVSFLPPGDYEIRIESKGFNQFLIDHLQVSPASNTTIRVVLETGRSVADPVNINIERSTLDPGTSTRSVVLGSETLSGLPLAVRNFTQLISLVPGVTTYLTDNTIVGRNTQNFSVNGARLSQNNIQINGVDAVGATSFVFPFTVASPAMEAISDLNVQTSMYDATFGRAGGGSVQAITKSGSNSFVGSVYDYFRNTVLMANSPFLKAAGVRRPVLQRNVFGFTLGGPIKNDRAFFFVSYQTTRERNGASRLNSLSVGVFIDPRLTDDRTMAGLMAAFGGSPIHDTAFRLLNARLPDGNFAIPTPQVAGRYNGSAASLYREDQFNTNFDFRITRRNWLNAKLFVSHAPSFLARAGAINVPGFGITQLLDQQLLAIQDIHSFRANTVNEMRIGYNNVRVDNIPEHPFGNSLFGIHRPGDAFGLPAIIIDQARGGIQFGTAALQSSLSNAPSMSLFDTISTNRGKHMLRIGGEIRHYRSAYTGNVQTRGAISFANFSDFLRGQTQTAQIGTGINDRSFRTTDYNFFIQDDWRFSPKLTVNLGLRYELDLPPYESQGRLAAFDPSLYIARPLSAGVTAPQGPPVAGFVRAGNGPQYDLPGVPIVSKRIVKSIDPNNFAPRLGFAYSPFSQDRVIIRGGYGLFYSRPSFQNIGSASYAPPFYVATQTVARNVSDPFIDAGPVSSFPKFVIGPPFTGNTVDRNNRTPYLEQFNVAAQFGLPYETVFEIAYVGTRGHKLNRQVVVNQARLAGSGSDQIINEVTGAVLTTNSATNAQLRATFQGVAMGTGVLLDQTSGTSNYDSVQVSVDRRLTHGLQFLASYTFAKSIDNSSGIGAGSGTTGLLNLVPLNEVTANVSDPSNTRSNRGVSDFDRTHRFSSAVIWHVPALSFLGRYRYTRQFQKGWEVSTLVTALSGLPIDIVDPAGGSLFVGILTGGARPNYAPGATRPSAMRNVPAGYFFDPTAFVRAQVGGGQPIPSSRGAFLADPSCSTQICTDFGNVGRNVLRGPSQFNVDVSLVKRFRIADRRSLEFRAEAFNVFNKVNFANPISNLNAGTDFGKIISTSNNPRIIQFGARINF